MVKRTFMVSLLAITLWSTETRGQGNLQATSTYRAGYVTLNEIKLYYEETGRGEPVVFIHGGFLDRRMGDDQFQVFTEHFRVIRYDVRGHGRSESVAETYSYHEDLRQLLKLLKVKKAILIGLSLGGRIAIDFAIAHPKRVAALVLAAPGLSGHPFDSPELTKDNGRLEKAWQSGNIDLAIEHFQEAWTDGPHRTPSQVDRVVRDKVRRMAKENAQRSSPRGNRTELEPPAIGRLAEITAPTLVILGDLDMPDILDIADRIEQEVPGARKVMMRKVAHMVNMEKPNEFNRIVLDFLTNLTHEN
ncbi:alpha/beta hydrolase [bacterium]|nr:alpha/beta hydrolase [bacterium]